MQVNSENNGILSKQPGGCCNRFRRSYRWNFMCRDEELTMVIRKELEQYNKNIFYLYDNHDLSYTSKGKLNGMLQKKNSYEMYKLKDFLLLILDSN